MVAVYERKLTLDKKCDICYNVDKLIFKDIDGEDFGNKSLREVAVGASH